MDVTSKGVFEVDEAQRCNGASEGEPLSVPAAIQRYHGSLLQFLRRRLRCPEDAHDVAQETYIRMMRYEGTRDIRSPSSMLFRIASNVANDLERAEQARHVTGQCTLDDVDLASDNPSPERELAGQQNLALLYEAIAELPPKCQQVFLLSRVRHMTYPEIARHCGISVKMVEKHISRALAFCAKRVGGDADVTS
ncbi:RNA polymerase sigma factor [Solimonas soli]|uniref:RNA polymerase sigma factor n=1 Tax=Solimonas soli TaxID=413479 RepID=UPI00146FA75B|nr:sigma-70 family RNA polymerase sigma factor [Solimonas soli]